MFVVEIGSADPSLRVHGNSLDTTGTLGNLDTLLLLASACVPGEDGGLGADLARDTSVARGVHTEAHDVIGVMVLIVGDVLGSGLNLATTEEFLRVRVLVKDNTESGSHVDSVALTIPVCVLLGVGATVTIDVLESVGLVGLLVVDWVMVVGLLDLTDPRANRHKLLTLSLFNLEEVVLATVVVLATIGASGGLTGFLVVLNASTIVLHLGIVVVLAWRRCA